MLTAQDVENMYKDYPERITSPVKMTNANEEIPIYKGKFTLKQDNTVVLVDGSIKFNWFPTIGVKFSGIADSILTRNFNIMNEVKLIVNGLDFASGYIAKQTFSDEYYVEGNGIKAVLGDKSIAVSKVKFGIPNLREYFGEIVKTTSENYMGTELARLKFENDEYIITLDKLKDYKSLHESLDSKGGFVILYAGEILKKKGSIFLHNLHEYLHCFDHFLYFLNGRRTALLFLTGIYADEEIWKDYTGYQVGIYRPVGSWSRLHRIDGLEEMWKSFTVLWKDENDRNFLENVIHWYIEANCQTAYVEGSIILAQTALELIYNWLLVERKKLIIGQDAENLSASNKIRLIISQLQISPAIPPAFPELLKLEKGTDGPEAFVLIRNGLVHGQEKKRKKLMSIPIMAKFEALQLGIWYIELSLLYILEYKGNYNNRASGNTRLDNGEPVPWDK